MTIATVHRSNTIAAPPHPHASMIAPPIDADGDGPLATVMDQVAAAMAADGMLVAWHDGDREPVLIFASGDYPAEMPRDLPPLRPRGAGEASEWRTDEEAADGGRLTTSIPTDAGIVTITSLFRRNAAAVSPHARDAASRLLPLIQPFFRLWSARRRTLSRVRGLTAAVNKSDVGIVLINRDGHPIFTNATADALIAEKDGLRRNGDMLNGTRLADTLRLHAAIEHVIAGTSSAPAPVVALERRDRRPLLAAVVACEAQPDHGEESAAIVYLFDPERDLAPLVEPACKLYGLSPVETRLTCLLADGSSLADAAVTMRVREQTARSYLKQIFLKTETNRQAELVWLMLKSSVRTVPGLRASLV